MTTTKRRRLRPWVVKTLEIMTGAGICLALLVMWCYVAEAVTGFNPLWLLGAM